MSKQEYSLSQKMALFTHKVFRRSWESYWENHIVKPVSLNINVHFSFLNPHNKLTHTHTHTHTRAILSLNDCIFNQVERKAMHPSPSNGRFYKRHKRKTMLHENAPIYYSRVSTKR